jgi:hypothetical protein
MPEGGLRMLGPYNMIPNDPSAILSISGSTGNMGDYGKPSSQSWTCEWPPLWDTAKIQVQVGGFALTCSNSLDNADTSLSFPTR